MAKKISSIHYSTDWPLNLADRNSLDWTKAIEIIQERFEARFLKQVEVLIAHPEKEIRVNSGFVVMSIDCLLVETLNQFYLGLKKTTDKYERSNNNANYQWNWQAFRDFFHHSSYFPDFKGNDEIVKTFFNEIRCGLLHQAESKTNSLINIQNRQMVIPVVDGDYSKGIIINRNLFHEALRKEFDRYISDLGNPDSTNIFGEFLRDNCNKKMVELCR